MLADCTALCAALPRLALLYDLTCSYHPLLRSFGGSAALRMRHTPCGCRSAHLVEVQPNFRLLPVSTMRRAKQCRYFARSLPPRKRHSRLTIVRRSCKWSRIAGIHGEAMYTAPTLRSVCSYSSYKLAMSGVEGPSPRPFSWGCKGDILFPRKRISPFAASPHGVGINPKKYHFLNFLIVSAMIFCFKIMLTST